jgi:hypothetical protein
MGAPVPGVLACGLASAEREEGLETKLAFDEALDALTSLTGLLLTECLEGVTPEVRSFAELEEGCTIATFSEQWPERSDRCRPTPDVVHAGPADHREGG